MMYQTHYKSFYNLLYTCHYILCVSKHVKFTISKRSWGAARVWGRFAKTGLAELDLSHTGHFVPPRDFYRGINFHEHMLTLLITTLQNCSLGE